jgi:flagellar basal-body rod protein FlgB
MGLPGIDNFTSLLTSFLDVQSRRAEIVSQNLANADTPNYVASELDFADYLRNAANDSLSPSLNSGKTGMAGNLRVVDQHTNAVGMDGNTVDVGHEMATLADAGMKYLEGAELLQMQIKSVRMAIREGR